MALGTSRPGEWFLTVVDGGRGGGGGGGGGEKLNVPIEEKRNPSGCAA